MEKQNTHKLKAQCSEKFLRGKCILHYRNSGASRKIRDNAWLGNLWVFLATVPFELWNHDKYMYLLRHREQHEQSQCKIMPNILGEQQRLDLPGWKNDLPRIEK